jgi:hypothetical protein
VRRLGGDAADDIIERLLIKGSAKIDHETPAKRRFVAVEK